MTKDDFKYYFPFIGTLFVIFGAIKLIIYYSLFGVKITSYFEFSEILTLFLEDMLFYSFILIFYLTTDLLLRTTDDKLLIIENFTKALDEKSFRKRFILYINAEIKIQYFLKVSLMFIVLYFLSKFKLSELKTILIFWWSLFVLRIILIEFRIKYNNYVQVSHTNIITIAFIFLGFSVFTAYSEFNSIMYDKKYLGTQVELTDTSLSTNHLYFYIGQTKNYIFFYDKKEKSCDVIPMSEVKKLTIKNNS